MTFNDTYKAQRAAIDGSADKKAQAEAERIKVELYRHALLRTDAGREVLADMLVKLNFFDETVDAEEATRRNYATKLLYDLGIFRSGNVGRVVDALATIQFTGGSDT